MLELVFHISFKRTSKHPETYPTLWNTLQVDVWFWDLGGSPYPSQKLLLALHFLIHALGLMLQLLSKLRKGTVPWIVGKVWNSRKPGSWVLEMVIPGCLKANWTKAILEMTRMLCTIYIHLPFLSISFSTFTSDNQRICWPKWLWFETEASKLTTPFPKLRMLSSRISNHLSYGPWSQIIHDSTPKHIHFCGLRSHYITLLSDITIPQRGKQTCKNHLCNH